MTPYAQLIFLGGQPDGSIYQTFATESEYRRWLANRNR